MHEKVTSTRPVKVGIITDIPIQETPQEERDRILSELINIGLDPNPVIASFDVEEVLNSNPDLLVVDYGGMSTAGAHDCALWNIEYLCKWAENHPGRLVVLWTYFTGIIYSAELAENFGYLDNVLYPTGFDMSEVMDKVKSWFGLG